MTISDLVLKIPDVVWSGIIASVLTLSGVLLSNRSNTNRLLLQLHHDATEKDKQRKADLRREVYLKAAEELVKASAHLGSIPQIDLAKTNAADGLQGLFAALAKFQLVSEVHTSALASQLSGKYAELLFRLTARSIPIQELRTDIEIVSDHYNRTQTEIQRVLAAMTKENESGKPDQSVFEALSKSFEFQQEKSAQLASERNELWRQRNAEHLKFSRSLVPETKEIARISVLVMVAIRNELGVGGDPDIFLENMEAQLAKLSSHLDEFLLNLENAQPFAEG
jgi:hypothetical protein